MMDTKQMREEFEACLLKEFVADIKSKADFPEGMAETIVKATLFGLREDGQYAAVVPRERWIGWQASRAAITIEFPLQTPYVEYYDDVEGGCFDYPKYLADVKAGIVAQGLKCGAKS